MAAFEQFLSDKYLSALHSPLLQSYMPQSASEKDRFELSSMSDAPTLLDFVGSTPAPVTKLLVYYYSTILALKRVAFAASWKGAAEDSFLLLCAWWTTCLYGELLIRYALPLLLILGPLVIPFIPQRFRNKKAAPLTEDALAESLSALDAIYALRPDWDTLFEWQPSFSPRERLRLLGFLFVPWVALTYWVSIRILIGIAGTILLTYRAPWFVTTRGILSRSAYARAAWRYCLSWLSGNVALPLSFKKTAAALSLGKSKDKVEEENKGTARQHSFLFTVLENQRWWVGIDWTAALLPSERPSWCAPISAANLSAPQSPQSPTQAQATYVPLPPPATFPLPASTSVILPSSDGKGYVKRTARWRWEDNSEWEVLVHKEGEKEVKTVRKPIKTSHSDEEAKGVALAKTATAGKTNNGIPSTLNVGEETAAGGVNAKVPPTPVAHAISEQEYTDQDGWIYGDNKWENASHKAGMGKFTRFRRWCRVAILEEEEEVVDDTETHPSFTQLEVPKVPLVEKPKTPVDPPVENSRQLKEASKEAHTREPSKKEESPERNREATRDSTVRDGSLQQRLKAALKTGS